MDNHYEELQNQKKKKERGTTPQGRRETCWSRFQWLSLISNLSANSKPDDGATFSDQTDSRISLFPLRMGAPTSKKVLLQIRESRKRKKIARMPEMEINNKLNMKLVAGNRNLRTCKVPCILIEFPSSQSQVLGIGPPLFSSSIFFLPRERNPCN